MCMELAVGTGSRVGTVVRNGTINGKELVEPSFAGGASGIVPDYFVRRCAILICAGPGSVEV